MAIEVERGIDEAGSEVDEVRAATGDHARRPIVSVVPSVVLLRRVHVATTNKVKRRFF